jgi:hypothetical protein
MRHRFIAAEHIYAGDVLAVSPSGMIKRRDDGETAVFLAMQPFATGGPVFVDATTGHAYDHDERPVRLRFNMADQVVYGGATGGGNTAALLKRRLDTNIDTAASALTIKAPIDPTEARQIMVAVLQTLNSGVSVRELIRRLHQENN